ncbi:helix-turn-helix domain-containing protein [Streptomyces cellulosae]|uniref:helix-turn-helix domain-containing protein n=1 Tax=Streptomyces cellulosae TaxID=1968 RepID=UPI0036C9B508
MSGYVRDAAVVEGAAAHILAELLATPGVRRYLRSRPATLQRDIEQAVAAIRRAAVAYETALVSATSGTGNAETPGPEIVQPFDREITTGEAAALLGLSERRARQLAAGGMGRRAGGRWLLDRTAVEEYRRRA